MSNPFKNQPVYGRDLCVLMRDINHLESLIIEQTGDIDIVMAVDCTGSMGFVIANVKANAQQVAQTMQDRAPGTWFGAIKFRDYGDAFVTSVICQPTANLAAYSAAVNTMAADGGGDWAEAYTEVVLQAAGTNVGFGTVTWRPGARRVLIIIGDSVPHDDEYYTGPPGSGYTWLQAAQAAAAADVTVSMIAVAGGVGLVAVDNSYGDMTRLTGGTYLECPDANDIADVILQMFDTVVIPMTTFYGYAADSKTPLGTPDAGVSVPADNALAAAGAVLAANHIIDMRAAIERIVGEAFFDNPATGAPFDFSYSGTNNLYIIAMGDRTSYGATGGLRYRWTRPLTQMLGTPPYDIDIGEVYECVRVLMAAAGV